MTGLTMTARGGLLNCKKHTRIVKTYCLSALAACDFNKVRLPLHNNQMLIPKIIET